ncbi:MFS transporter [Streptomyces sp. VNUA24]|uniref:MFS transporter n=1 Tax=Streptomyces sp. VNUA24 TaxID=3031131 RepID=UPI0023B7FE5F|nr:MFS transporter [Streptomyces sp. VNUA24]WEH13070.1 MFS transporter [Streptomyces sp. VNUA24]
MGARLALIALALMWPTQLLSLAGLLGGNAQASVALHFRTTEIAWFILVNALVATVIMPFVVKFADFYGKRNVMIVLSVLGLAGDIVAALATNYEMLLIGRGIAGFYGPIGALAYASVRELFPPKHVGAASGMIGSGIAFVALGGPFLTGWVIDSFGWRGVMWSLTIATAIGLLLLLFVVPETPQRTARTKVNWLGGALLGGGAGLLTYGIGKGGEWGWTDTGALAFMLGGVAAVVLYVVSDLKVAHPLFDLSMMARKSVWTMMLATALIAATMYGTGVIGQLLVLFPKIPGVSDGLGMTATHYAVIGIPASILILLIGFGTGVALRKVDARLPLALGAAFAAVGFLLQRNWHYTDVQLALLGTFTAIAMGLVVASVPVLIIEAVTPEEQATANGLHAMIQGVFTTVITQLVYVILSQKSMVAQGTRFYLDAGYKNAMLFGAGLAVLGLLACALIPRLKPAEDIETGKATTAV